LLTPLAQCLAERRQRFSRRHARTLPGARACLKELYVGIRPRLTYRRRRGRGQAAPPSASLRSMPRLPTCPIAAGSLIAGFAVAELTGVRAIGGLVLVAAMLWCGLRWRAALGLGRALTLVAVYLVAFALSHLLGLAIGAWPAVLATAVIV